MASLHIYQLLPPIPHQFFQDIRHNCCKHRRFWALKSALSCKTPQLHQISLVQ